MRKRIIVCIKQVPNTNNVHIDPKSGTLIREGVESIINPDDRHALEAGLALKDAHGYSVTVLTMGPPQADVALREALAMGADDAVLLSDRAFAGADTWATSTTLAAAIRKIGPADLVLCGHQAIDGDTAQVGPQIAKMLEIPQATFVSHLEIVGNEARATRALEDRHVTLRLPLPALVTCTHELNTPRYPSAAGIFAAFQREIPVWTAEMLGLDPEMVGLKGSPTQVIKSFVPNITRKSEVLKTGDHDQDVRALVARLKFRQVLPETRN